MMHKSQRTENGMKGENDERGAERHCRRRHLAHQYEDKRSVSCSNVFWVQLGSSLQCVREFVKAFRERGGNLHIAERQHREVILMPPHQSAHTNRTHKIRHVDSGPRTC